MEEFKKHIYDEPMACIIRWLGTTTSPNRPALYNELILSGKLWTYLADLNEQAQKRMNRLINQMKAAENITEELKVHDPMAWVGTMNNIRNRAEEIVRSEIIYH